MSKERGTPKALFKGSDNLPTTHWVCLWIWYFMFARVEKPWVCQQAFGSSNPWNLFFFFSFCSQLQYFPKILENMANLRHLDLNETIIKELPASIEHLNRLEVLILHSCENLVTLLESIFNLCFLEVLDVSYCSKLHKLPQNLGRLQSLKHLGTCGLNSTCYQLLSLSGLCSL